VSSEQKARLSNWGKPALLEMATEMEIPGRHKMTKDELVDVLAETLEGLGQSIDDAKETLRPITVADNTTEGALLSGNTDDVAVEGTILEVGAPVTAEAIELQTRALQEVALSDQQKELIRRQLPDTPPQELERFFYLCARTGLDPLANQIYLVERRGRWIVQTGIDGYRLVAARTGLMAGSDDPVFEPPDTETDVPQKASVTVWRIASDGIRYPYGATARWSEYAPDLNAKQSFMWKKMPFLMLGKVAEALALRKAFPAELSGLYTDDEMAQSAGESGGEAAPQRRSTPPAAIAGDKFCPACEKAGNRVPVIDQRAKHAEQDKLPAWACSAKGRCAQGTKFGWGSWDPGYFDEVETSGGHPDQVITRGRPSMSGLIKVKESPLAAARAWVVVLCKNNMDEARLLVASFVSEFPRWLALKDGGEMTEAQALELEKELNAFADKWEAPF